MSISRGALASTRIAYASRKIGQIRLSRICPDLPGVAVCCYALDRLRHVPNRVSNKRKSKAVPFAKRAKGTAPTGFITEPGEIRCDICAPLCEFHNDAKNGAATRPSCQHFVSRSKIKNGRPRIPHRLPKAFVDEEGASARSPFDALRSISAMLLVSTDRPLARVSYSSRTNFDSAPEQTIQP